MTTDLKRFFINGEHGLKLNPCGCCGAEANVSIFPEYTLIVCSKNGCRTVQAINTPEAEKLWNDRDFRSQKVKAA